MRQKDMTEKLLEDYEDVFADIMNVLLFKGEKIVLPETLSDEQVEMFQSDFRIVAEFFTQMRKNSRYKPSSKQIRHVDAVLKLLSVFGQTDKLERFIELEEMKEGLTMNRMLDEIEERGIEKGIEQGITRGIVALVKTLREFEKDNETIIKKLMENFSLTEEEAKKYI